MRRAVLFLGREDGGISDGCRRRGFPGCFRERAVEAVLDYLSARCSRCAVAPGESEARYYERCQRGFAKHTVVPPFGLRLISIGSTLGGERLGRNGPGHSLRPVRARQFPWGDCG